MSVETTTQTQAVLLRGLTYTYQGILFKRDAPRPVSAELASELEDLSEEFVDSEGEVTYKPIFRIIRSSVEGESGGLKAKATRVQRRRV